MQVNLEFPGSQNIIRAYGEGWITVNDQIIHQSVIVMPEQLIPDWPPRNFQQLSELHFQILEELRPEIVLLGTGRRQQFPHPSLLRPLLRRNVGVEVMDTAAACRTYNIIVSEGRRVAAALLIE